MDIQLISSFTIFELKFGTLVQFFSMHAECPVNLIVLRLLYNNMRSRLRLLCDLSYELSCDPLTAELSGVFVLSGVGRVRVMIQSSVQGVLSNVCKQES